MLLECAYYENASYMKKETGQTYSKQSLGFEV